MTFSETLLSPNIQESIIQIGGYTIARQDRGTITNDACSKKNGGGLSIYYQDYLDCDTSKWQYLNKSNDNLELQIVEFNVKSRNLILFNIYRPPSGNTDDWLIELQTALDEVNQRNKNLDINIRENNNAHAKKLKDLVNNNNLKQITQDYTRCTRNTRSTIDLIITNMPHINKCGVVNYNISDHQLIYLNYKKEREKLDKVTFTGRTYRNYTKDLLYTKLQNIDTTPILASSDPAQAWDLLFHQLLSIADNICVLYANI